MDKTKPPGRAVSFCGIWCQVPEKVMYEMSDSSTTMFLPDANTNSKPNNRDLPKFPKTEFRVVVSYSRLGTKPDEIARGSIDEEATLSIDTCKDEYQDAIEDAITSLCKRGVWSRVLGELDEGHVSNTWYTRTRLDDPYAVKDTLHQLQDEIAERVKVPGAVVFVVKKGERAPAWTKKHERIVQSIRKDKQRRPHRK